MERYRNHAVTPGIFSHGAFIQIFLTLIRKFLTSSTILSKCAFEYEILYIKCNKKIPSKNLCEFGQFFNFGQLFSDRCQYHGHFIGAGSVSSVIWCLVTNRWVASLIVIAGDLLASAYVGQLFHPVP